jgi:hypothetical protein
MFQQVNRSLRGSNRIAQEELVAGEPVNRPSDPTHVAGRCTDIAGCPLKVLLNQHRGNTPNPGTSPR